MKDTKIKVKVDVMDVLKRIQKHCQNNDCGNCEFAYINKYCEVCCRISCTPMLWKIKERK